MEPDQCISNQQSISRSKLSTHEALRDPMPYSTGRWLLQTPGRGRCALRLYTSAVYCGPDVCGEAQDLVLPAAAFLGGKVEGWSSCGRNWEGTHHGRVEGGQFTCGFLTSWSWTLTHKIYKLFDAFWVHFWRDRRAVQGVLFSDGPVPAIKISETSPELIQSDLSASSKQQAASPIKRCRQVKTTYILRSFMESW